MKATIQDSTFKTAVSEIMRFPMSSALAGSEMVYFRVIPGKQRSKLEMYGGVSIVARTSCPAEGEVPHWYAIDGRILQPFVEKASQPIEILFGKKRIVLSAGADHRTEVPLFEGPEEIEKQALGTELGKLTEADAQAINYLSQLTPDMQIRPDLSCVALESKMAVACGQRIVARAMLESLDVQAKLPALLVRSATEGDHIFSDGKSCTLGRGAASYAMPLPAETVNFPWDGAQALLKADSSRIAESDGDEFAEACQRASDCLGFVTKIGAFLEITGENNSLLMVAQSGTAKYRTRVKATVRNSGLSMHLPIDEAVLLAKICHGTMHFSVGKKNKELHLVTDKVHLVVASGKPEEE